MRTARYAFAVCGLALAVSAAPASLRPDASRPRGVLQSQALPMGFCDNVTAEAGYYNINDAYGKKAYFYQFFESRRAPSTDPVVLWLTGGPGCSSQLALYTENGPCSVNAAGTGTVRNPYSWNNQANMIWADQPAGTGFSTGDEVSDEAGVSTDLYNFLQAFFAAHPQLVQNPFYIFGESYGGHFVPAAAYAVYTGNQNPASGDVVINLQGIGIGNGLTDPLIQYQYYPQMAYNYSMQKLGHSVVPLKTYSTMMSVVPPCINMISQCQNTTSECPTAQSFCDDNLMGPYENTGLSPYDIRKTCEYPPLCIETSNVETFLNTPAVQKTLGVNLEWTPCNFVVNSMFGNDWMKTFHQLLPPMMADGIDVLIYAGDCDFVCNWLGNQAWTLALDWQGNAGFNGAPFSNWTVNGLPAGQLRTFETLNFLRVFNAGHMAPSDQPVATLAMFNAFTSGQPIA